MLLDCFNGERERVSLSSSSLQLEKDGEVSSCVGYLDCIVDAE